QASLPESNWKVLPCGLPPPEGIENQHQPRKPSRESLIRTGLNSGVQALLKAAGKNSALSLAA
ncbi:MAG: hypothetical protein VYC82_03975, partial [Verrucomicrobiota bacterium]|nr:hypothetical protein [Verrucomicrobiota bacterium]